MPQIRKEWLSGVDSNHLEGYQKPLCCHYITGQFSLIIPYYVSSCLRGIKKDAARQRMKGRTKMLKRIYVCYHENSRELAADCGSMSDLLVTTKPQDAFRWVYDSIEKTFEWHFSVYFNIRFHVCHSSCSVCRGW